MLFLFKQFKFLVNKIFHGIFFVIDFIFKLYF